MATVEQVMDKTLKILVVAGAEAAVEGAESEDFIFSLNNFMNNLESGQYTETVEDSTVTYGIDLSWTDVSSTSDPMPIPAGAIEGTCYAMAKRLAPEYGVVLPPELERLARDGLNDLVRIGTSIPPAKLPQTFPIGSGNEYDGTGFAIDHFYQSDGTLD